jgi:hypothetical protein
MLGFDPISQTAKGMVKLGRHMIISIVITKFGGL